MAQKHLKTCPTLLVNREMQIKTTLRFHLTSIRMTKIKNSCDSRCWQGCRKRGHSWWDCKLVLSHFYLTFSILPIAVHFLQELASKCHLSVKQYSAYRTHLKIAQVGRTALQTYPLGPHLATEYIPLLYSLYSQNDPHDNIYFGIQFGIQLILTSSSLFSKLPFL